MTAIMMKNPPLGKVAGAGKGNGLGNGVNKAPALGAQGARHLPTGPSRTVDQRPAAAPYLRPLPAAAVANWGAGYTCDAAPPGLYRGGPNGRCIIYSRHDDPEEVAAMRRFCDALDAQDIRLIKEIFCDSKCGRYAITIYGWETENSPLVQRVLAAFESSIKGHGGVDVFREYEVDEEECICSRLSDLYPAE